MKFLKLTFLTIILSFILFTYGCASNNLQSADLVLKNGFVFTVDSLNTKAEAIAVKDGKIIFVGENEVVKSFIGEKTKVIDINGKMMLPGFIDSHAHPISSYRYFYELNLYGIKSSEEIQQAIKKYLSEHPASK